MRRTVSRGEGESLAKSWKVPFFETSAKTRINIEETVHELLRHTPRTGTEYRVVIVGSGGVVSFSSFSYSVFIHSSHSYIPNIFMIKITCSLYFLRYLNIVLIFYRENLHSLFNLFRIIL